MRLGKKKEKDRDMEKEQLVDGVARLICSPKSHQAPLRGKVTFSLFVHSLTLKIYLFQSTLTALSGLASNSFNYHHNGKHTYEISRSPSSEPPQQWLKSKKTNKHLVVELNFSLKQINKHI